MGVIKEKNVLAHFGIQGMKWGVRRFQNLDGTLTEAGKKRYNTLFVSGSSKTQDKESPYYRRNLPKFVKSELKKSMKSGDKIIVGEAPGIDRQVQDFLNKKKYQNVSVYTSYKDPRYKANEKWQTKSIDASEYKEGSPEFLAKKDKAMTDDATKGLAVILDQGSRATKENVKRLIGQNKGISIYQLTKNQALIKGFGNAHDSPIDYDGTYSTDAGKTFNDYFSRSKADHERVPIYEGTSKPEAVAQSVSAELKKIKYSEFSKLQSPEETEKKGSGSCHDQVILTLDKLKKAGIDAKARFMIEYDPQTSKGGTTHSYVYIPTRDGVIWIENAWGGHAGTKKYSSVSDIEKMYKTARSSGEWGNSKKYSKVEFQDFNPKDHEYGETLEELVNKTLK